MTRETDWIAVGIGFAIAISVGGCVAENCIRTYQAKEIEIEAMKAGLIQKIEPGTWTEPRRVIWVKPEGQQREQP